MLHNYLHTNLIQDWLHFPSTTLLAMKYNYYITVICMAICYYYNLTLFLYPFPTGPHHHSSRHWLWIQIWVEDDLDEKLQVEVPGMWTLWLDGLPQKANQAAQNKNKDNGIKVDQLAPLHLCKTVPFTPKKLYDHKQKMLWWPACEESVQRTISSSKHRATKDCLNVLILHFFAYFILVSHEDGPVTG